MRAAHFVVLLALAPHASRDVARGARRAVVLGRVFEAVRQVVLLEIAGRVRAGYHHGDKRDGKQNTHAFFRVLRVVCGNGTDVLNTNLSQKKNALLLCVCRCSHFPRALGRASFLGARCIALLDNLHE